MDYILEGEHSITFTGDIRLHGKREAQSMDFIESAKKTKKLTSFRALNLTSNKLTTLLVETINGTLLYYIFV